MRTLDLSKVHREFDITDIPKEKGIFPLPSHDDVVVKVTDVHKEAALFTTFSRKEITNPHVITRHDSYEVIKSDLDDKPLWYVPLKYVYPLFHQGKRQIPPMKAAGGLMTALKFLHARGYLHGDINPENLGVSKEGNLVISDLGNVKYIDDDGVQGGTPQYMSSERFKGEKYGFEEDIVGAGVVIFQMILNDPTKFPWRLHEENGRRPAASSYDDMDLPNFENRLSNVPQNMARELYYMIFPGEKFFFRVQAYHWLINYNIDLFRNATELED